MLGHDKCLNELLRSGGAPILAQDQFGNTAAHIACLNNQSRALSAILARAGLESMSESMSSDASLPNPAASAIDHAGRTPMHAAAYVCSIECCKVLRKEALAPIDQRDQFLRTPIYWCIASRASQRFGSIEVV
jgi:ankyrin repeat protein